MVININNKYNIDNNEPLVVGTSSGPDSMALLHHLKTTTNNPIICCHINHNVRAESKEEEEYLKNYCQKENIIFESMTINEYKENNFENEARKKRYSFYEKTLNKHNSKYLFLAHHGDDLVETILMKISRGSSLEGYAGIKEVSKQNNYYIIRPFLEYTKEDLINYNHKNNIKYYIDKSNEDIKYTRNRYRKLILPILKEENTNIHKSFLKYSKTLLEYDNYIDRTTNNILNNIYKDNTLDLTKFINEDIFIQKNILYKILQNIYNNQNNIIKEKHIIDLINIIKNKKPNIEINLPNDLIAKKEYTKLTFYKKNTNKELNYKIEVTDKKIQIDNIIIKKINNTDEDGNNICKLNSKNIQLPLYIRNKQDGDFIYQLGLNGRKKVKEIFIENKVPKNLRNNYPILVDSNNQILWIPNLKKSKFNSKKNEFYDIILKYCEKEENNEQ